MAGILGLPTTNEFNGLDIKNMSLNSAYMLMNTSLSNIGVYVLRDDCFNCPFKLERRPEANVESAWQFDTSVQSTWRILNTNKYDELATNQRSGLLCEMRPNLGEFGVYRVLVGGCNAEEELAPVYPYIPLLLFLTIFLSAYFMYGFIKFAKRRRVTQDDEIATKIETEKILQSDSLQVLRGIIITLLMFITSGGGGYPLFNIQYGSLSMADVVFFFYTWTVGAFIPIYVDNARAKGRSKWYLVREIILRSVALMILGTLIDSTVHTKPGTSLWRPLQRLGISYVIVGTAYVLTVQKFVVKSKKLICKMAENLVSLLWCWILSGFLLAIIVILISTFVSFNCVANMDLKDSSVDHSGITSEYSTQTCNNNLTMAANVIFVADQKKMLNVFNYVGFSKGLLGITTTIMTTMIGLKSGDIYVRYTAHDSRLLLWSCWSLLFLLSAAGFMGIRFALNFNLLPISTIILLPTFGMLLSIFICTMTEVLQFPKIFKSSGLSSIAIFTGHLLFSNAIPFVWNIALNSHIMYLIQNLWTILLWTVIGMLLVKKNITINL